MIDPLHLSLIRYYEEKRLCFCLSNILHTMGESSGKGDAVILGQNEGLTIHGNLDFSLYHQKVFSATVVCW